QATCDTGSSRVPVPAHRRRRGGGEAGGTCAWHSAGLVDDMAGPRVYEMAELLRGYLRASHHHRPIIAVWLPGKAARALRAGANRNPQRAVGRRTWEEFLAERVRSPSDSRSSLA